MRASARIGRILGIPIYVHVSFLVVIPLFAWFFGFDNATIFGFELGFGGLSLDWTAKALLGTVAALVFFFSILLHELAHSYVAVRYGYKISGITLFIFGGVSQIEKAPPRAPGEATMAFVGPAVSVFLGAILMALSLLSKSVATDIAEQVLIILFGLIGFYNVILGVFNLLPAFPMDGGRILRAALAKRMSFLKATDTAAGIGKAFAIAMGLMGLFFSIWFIFIALFLYLGASEEQRETRLSYSLEGVKVREIMTHGVATVPLDMNVKSLLDKMLSEKHLVYPVVDNSSNVVGMITLQDLASVPPGDQSETKVSAVMTKRFISIAPDADAAEAIRLLPPGVAGALVVMVDNNLAGILTRTDFAKAVEILATESRFK